MPAGFGGIPGVGVGGREGLFAFARAHYGQRSPLLSPPHPPPPTHPPQGLVLLVTYLLIAAGFWRVAGPPATPSLLPPPNNNDNKKGPTPAGPARPTHPPTHPIRRCHKDKDLTDQDMGGV